MKTSLKLLLDAFVLALTGCSAIDSPIRQNTAVYTSRPTTKQEGTTEAIIRERVEDWAKALRTRNIDGVASFYAPGIVSFDLPPPLRYAGTDNKRRAWQNFFAARIGPVGYEVRDLNVTAQGDLAFVYSVNHVSGRLASGHITDLWVRWTACFRRIDGVWLIVHDHVSVPADIKLGQAALNLTP